MLLLDYVAFEAMPRRLALRLPGRPLRAARVERDVGFVAGIHVAIDEPADLALILGMVFCCLRFEELDALLAKNNGKGPLMNNLASKGSSAYLIFVLAAPCPSPVTGAGYANYTARAI